jgi:Ca-activated chloride channel family protein
MTITLNAGFPLAEVLSTYHPVDVVAGADNRYHVMLANDAVPADRDFELVWSPQVGAAPAAALLTEARDGNTYALLMVMPPAATDDAPRMAREIVYIIDTSGSMEGTSIVQAKAALAMALDRLQPGDRFNVIEFNSLTRLLFAAPMPVDPATIGAARAFVSKLRARGGTEMKPALEAALAPDAAPGFVRQVVFLTDGAVGNDAELINLIGERLGERRLFTVGIGSAPNAYFMTKAAQFGRGTYTYIGDVREVGAKMGSLFRKLESPVLTDLVVTWPGAVEAFPRALPDVYAGEPVVVTAALASAIGDVTISGRRGDTRWEARVALAPDGIEPGIGVLWARAKIDALTDAMKGGAGEAEIRPAIVDVALTHHLVSKYTSLVAVDITPTAPAGTMPTRGALATNLPHGMSYDAVFGGLPQTATPAPLMMSIGIAALLIALFAWRARARVVRVSA